MIKLVIMLIKRVKMWERLHAIIRHKTGYLISLSQTSPCADAKQHYQDLYRAFSEVERIMNDMEKEYNV